MKVRLVVFKDGHRLVKPFDDHKEAARYAKQLPESIRKRIVTNVVVPRFSYPSGDDDLTARAEGKLWCPFCRDWSYFRVPKFKHGVTGSITDEPMFLNSCHRQDIKVCSWCHITELDFNVRMANNTFGEERRRRRKKKRTR